MLDTADTYGAGANEELVGSVVRNRRDGAIVATEFKMMRDENDRRTKVALSGSDLARIDAAMPRAIDMSSLDR